MKRVLFVDDEPNILEGLQRMLRPQRREWDMVFAQGADEALAILERKTIDVVVTDMQMPGMDGAALLQCVHARFPNVMRIILSGQFSIEAGMRAVPVAHQFLTKPCDPAKLRAAIECSLPSNKGLPEDVVKRVASSIGSLPSLPTTCADLLQAIEDPSTSLDSIGRIIAQDVALTAKVLQLANSAFFSLPQALTDVKTSVAFLGAEVLRQLVMSAQILRTFTPARPIQGFSLTAFEQHSGLTARIAAQLPTHGSIASLRTMTALLHDVGKLVLATQLPRELEAAYLVSTQEKIPLHQAEQRVLGADHGEVGAILLNLWGLPGAAVDAIAAHHHPVVGEGSPESLPLVAVVHIANAIAHDLAQPVTDPLQMCYLDADYIHRLGVAGRMEEWRRAARRPDTN